MRRSLENKQEKTQSGIVSTMLALCFYIIGFSQLSDMEFFVDPKNEMSETEIHPLCGWE